MIVQENIVIIFKLLRFTTYIAFNKTISDQTKELRRAKLKRTLLNLQKNLIN